MFVLLPILSPFNCIMTHLILYQIFNRPNGANRDVRVRRTDTSYTYEPAKGYRGNANLTLPQRIVGRCFQRILVRESCEEVESGLALHLIDGRGEG